MANKKVKKAVDSSHRVEVDSYDRGIIPAEIAARKEREGENFKTLPTEEAEANAATNEQTHPDSIRTTDGYTIDQEGLLNNYAVEPEMYYEEPGDAREQIAEDTAERLQELKEVKNDQEGRLTQKRDRRGKGPGIV